jgi:hypothetical protein
MRWRGATERSPTWTSDMLCSDAQRDAGTDLFDLVRRQETDPGFEPAQGYGLHLKTIGSRILLQTVLLRPLQQYEPRNGFPSGTPLGDGDDDAERQASNGSDAHHGSGAGLSDLGPVGWVEANPPDLAALRCLFTLR